MSRVACRVRRLRPRLLLAMSENEVLAAGQMPDAGQGLPGRIGTSRNHLFPGWGPTGNEVAVADCRVPLGRDSGGQNRSLRHAQGVPGGGGGGGVMYNRSLEEVAMTQEAGEGLTVKQNWFWPDVRMMAGIGLAFKIAFWVAIICSALTALVAVIGIFNVPLAQQTHINAWS